MPENPQSSGKVKDVALLLRNADRLVKESQYDAALEVIGRARELDPRNPYAIAYEERVRSAMKQLKKDQPAGIAGKAVPSTAGHPPSKPVAGPRRPEAPARLTDSARREDSARRSAIDLKIQALLRSAEEFRAKKDLPRALDEVSRAFLLDPAKESTRSLKVELQRAVEEERRRAEEERLKLEREAEVRHQQMIQAEIAKLQKEKEERQNKEEEARKRAQIEKMQQYLARSKQLLAEGRYESALNELAFVVVIDPYNEEAFDLQATIHERQEQARHEEEERQRRKEEQERQKRAAVDQAIRKHMDSALQLAKEGKFNEGLRIITRAYVLDPANVELPACEQKVIAMQEEAMRADEARRRRQEEEDRKRKEEDLKRLEQEERDRLVRGESAAAEERRREAKGKIGQHLVDARTELSAGHYDNALAEVALAFLIDPFDADVRKMEEEILAAQEQSRRENQLTQEGPRQEEVEDEAANVEAVQSHVQEAQRLRAAGEYDRALDELAKAFIIDPLNEEVAQCEQAIEEDRQHAIEQGTVVSNQDFQEETAPQESGGAHSIQVQEHIKLAQEYLGSGSFEEALAEIAIGLIVDPENSDLQQLEQEIWSMQLDLPPESETDNREESDRLIQIHLLAAEEFQKQDDFALALDEVARAYVIDPMNPEIKKAEVRIRQNQARQSPSNVQSLKLVYPNGRAAGGSR